MQSRLRRRPTNRNGPGRVDECNCRRTAVVCHDIHPLLDPDIGKLRHRIYAERFRRELKRMQEAAWIVSVSEHTRMQLLQYFPKLSSAKVVAIHNGLDRKWQRVTDQAWLSDFRRKLGIMDKRVVLHVGNDVWYKNVPSVLRAVSRLTESDVVLVHAGSLSRETQALAAELRLGDRFMQLAGVDDAQLAALYSSAEVLVFPSLSEGFGWPPLEAMACGCPVITSRRASLPEVTGDACVYVEPTDIDSIAGAVRSIMSDPNFSRELSARGVQRANQFSWADTANRMLQLFAPR